MAMGRGFEDGRTGAWVQARVGRRTSSTPGCAASAATTSAYWRSAGAACRNRRKRSPSPSAGTHIYISVTSSVRPSVVRCPLFLAVVSATCFMYVLYAAVTLN